MTGGGEIERRLWDALYDAANGEAYRKVRIGKLADDHLPVPHKQWTVETVRSWANDGYVVAYKSGAIAAITEKGIKEGPP